MKTRNLHPDFGVEIIGIDLTGISASNKYPEIRDLFEKHSLLLFRGQSLDDAGIVRLGWFLPAPPLQHPFTEEGCFRDQSEVMVRQ